MKQALIIFIKNPILGNVKTRLAKTIGDIKALEIYHQLLQHTQSITKNLKVDRFVFYSDEIVNDDIWNDLYFKRIQCKGHLGVKMNEAFNKLFLEDYKAVVIIGSDCMQLSQKHINDAFEKLKTYEAVIGPAFDGGYYLLGTNNYIPQLFSNIEWSTENVFNDTIKLLSNNTYNVLERLRDIDTEDDWNKYLNT